MRRVVGAFTKFLDELEDRFVVAALLIVVSIITTAVGGDHQAGQLVLVVVESFTLIVILKASKVKRHTLRVASVVIAVAAVGTMTAISFDRQSAGPGLIGAALALVAPVVIVRRVVTHARIDIQTVGASLCIYLLAGVFFAYVYQLMDLIGDGPFFAQKAAASSVDFVYFSFVTLTTLGYGDLTPAQSMGKMLAISEALLGQLYLVSVVALLVANLGRDRRPRPFERDPEP
jgi:hypothetical protein